MNDTDDLQRLEQRLAALQVEHAVRKTELETACQARLGSRGALLTAGAVGCALGLLGRGHHRRDVPPAPVVSTGGATLLGGLMALAGLAGAALRVLELGLFVQSSTRREP